MTTGYCRLAQPADRAVADVVGAGDLYQRLPRPLRQRSGSTPHDPVAIDRRPRQHPLSPPTRSRQHPRLRRSTGSARSRANPIALPVVNAFPFTRAPDLPSKAIAPSAAVKPPRHARRSQIPIEPAAQSVPHPPRFRALALFRRRPPQRRDRFVTPASENLHKCRRSIPAPLDLSVETRLHEFQIRSFEFVVSSSSLGRCRYCSLLLPDVLGAQLGIAAKSIA
jgi:hypothetical protein